MDDFSGIFAREAKVLKRDVAKDIAYFYTKHIPTEQAGNNLAAAQLPVPAKEKARLDFGGGDSLQALSTKSKLSGYDILKAELQDRIAGFYENADLHPTVFRLPSVPKQYTDSFAQEKKRMLETTIEATLRELSYGLIRGETPLSVVNSVDSVLDKRLHTLNGFLESKYRQLGQYMLLWEYQQEGFDRYIFITEGHNCDSCDSLGGKVFSMDEAEVGVNLPPLHPNCDCTTGIVDKDDTVVAVLLNEEDRQDTPGKEQDWLAGLQAVLSKTAELPRLRVLANAAIHSLKEKSPLSGNDKFVWKDLFYDAGRIIKDYLTGRAMPFVPSDESLIDTAKAYVRNDPNVTEESMRAAWFAGWLGATRDTLFSIGNTALNPFGTGYRIGGTLDASSKTAMEYYASKTPAQMLEDIKGIAPFFWEAYKDSNWNERMLALGAAYGAVTTTLAAGKAMKEAADKGAAASKGAGSKIISSVDDVVSNPQNLFGKSKADVSKILGDGWTEGAYGSSKTGWKFIKGDQSIFYHPGGDGHGGSYYGYSSGATGKIKIVGPDYGPIPGDKTTIIKGY